MLEDKKKSEGREKASHRLTVIWERKPMTEMLMSVDGACWPLGMHLHSVGGH